MSYCSENILPPATPLTRLVEVVELLGFKKSIDRIKIDNQVGSYVWIGDDNNISFVGVELYIYKKEDCISVETRTRVGRSYWDLKLQNKTISLIKSLFGGTFYTDEGVNRYMPLYYPEPSKISCSLYVNRWIFNNAIAKPKIYLQSRSMTGDVARNESTGIYWLDEMNPRVLSNNMIIPYLIGCWESYFRNSYISILKYSYNIPDNALKNCRISPAEYLKVIKKEEFLEMILADSLSFQRPYIIAENFRKLNANIDITSWLKRPYHRRRKTLLDSITEIVETRDYIVHTGNMDLRIFDKQIHNIMNDLTEAVDRAYQGFGQVFEFDPSYDF